MSSDAHDTADTADTAGAFDLPDALLRPAAWPEPLQPQERVELVETHSAWILLGRALAYKVKQAVRFPFLDFSRPEQREAALRAELELNAPLAPGVYRRLVSITRASHGLEFDGDGEHVEWALEMQRLPAADMFAARLAAGTLDAAPLRRLAERLAALHAEPLDAGRAREHASPDAVRALFTGNAEELLDEFERTGDDAATQLAAAYVRDVAGAVDRARDALARRLEQGRVRDGHGDLHLGNICLLDGEPVVYDRLEFEPAFRIQDVAADVAFLVMDLRVHGRDDLAEVFVDAYAEHADDPGVRELLELHVAHRAAVRAKVEAIRHRLGRDRAAASAARAYLVRAWAGVRERPTALLVGGLSGTGKSSMARELCGDTGWEWLRTDVIRKRLFGLPPTARVDAAGRAALYAPGVTERVYAELLERARAHWAAGRSTVLDGTWLQRDRRRVLLDAAAAAGAAPRVAWLTCPDALTRRRIEERGRRDDDPSDADVAVYERQLAAQQPPGDDEPAVQVDSRLPLERQVLEALAGEPGARAD